MPPDYQALIDKFPEILKVNFLEKPKHDVHEIVTNNAKPCKAKPRPILSGTKKAVESKKTWLELERLGVISRAKAGEPTTWTSPLHLALKSDGTYRPCGDYRSLNAKTVDDSFPLPNIRHFASELQGCTHFSTIDLFRAYYNIELSPESRLAGI